MATIDRFKSDFKVIARFFKDKRLNRSAITNDSTEIKHVNEVMEMLAAFTNDNRYIEAIVDVEKLRQSGGTVTMCWIAQMLEEKGIEKGIEEGIEKGRIELLCELVNDKIITLEDAAKKTGCSIEELETMFRKTMSLK